MQALAIHLLNLTVTITPVFPTNKTLILSQYQEIISKPDLVNKSKFYLIYHDPCWSTLNLFLSTLISSNFDQI